MLHGLDICGRQGITLNLHKFIFAADTVEFAGFQITSDNVQPSKKYLEVIRNSSIPNNIRDMCSWFGVINHPRPNADILRLPQTRKTFPLGKLTL